MPEGPPTCTACGSCAPQSCSTCATLTPSGYSYTPGRAQSPLTAWSLVPVLWAVPRAFHQALPCRAMCAAAQKVSTLFTQVGWPR